MQDYRLWYIRIFPSLWNQDQIITDFKRFNRETDLGVIRNIRKEGKYVIVLISIERMEYYDLDREMIKAIINNRFDDRDRGRVVSIRTARKTDV